MGLTYRDPDVTGPMCMPEAPVSQSPAVSQPYGNGAAADQLTGGGLDDPARARGLGALTQGIYGNDRQVAGQTVGGDTGGLGGFLDSTTRLFDRMSASAELRDRFDVVPDDFVGPRLPNQVTASEYDQIVNTYSDIRTGHSNVRFDNSQLSGDAATNFQGNVMSDLASMMQTPSGREMINGMAYGKNADGSAHAMTIRGITNPGGAQAIPGVEANTSNGTGTNTTIEYAPGQSIVNPGKTGVYGSVRSDMTLYHEMVHAHHMRNGDEDTRTLTAATATDRRDRGLRAWEYQAMGLGSHANDPYSENRYRAERRAMGDTNGTGHWDRYTP